MSEPSKMTNDALMLALATNEEQIDNLRKANRDIINEMKRRKNYYLDKWRRGDLQMELSEEITITEVEQ